MKTRITELLGIKYPIICGGMYHVGKAYLVAAVSESGGIGFITSAHYETPEILREEIRLARGMTKKPLGVNLTLSPRKKRIPNEAFIEVLIEEGIRVVETTGKGIEQHIKKLKDHGVIVIHKVPGVRYAKKAEALGVDAVAVVGIEAGGHPGKGDIGNLVLVPRVVDSVGIPVIAAGGIGDGRGFAAALALGAEAVLMATRFMGTKESGIHNEVKKWMIQATEMDTTIIQKSIGSATRVSKNSMAIEVLEMEKRGATVEELLPFITGEKSKNVFYEGDIEGGVWSCGTSVGFIKDVPTVKELIERTVKEAEEVLTRRSNLFSN